jgi:energy-coupling factor transporter ATP-binding protein EcfA2
METTDLQVKLASLEHLLPSQREWAERLLFQLAFNDVDHIEAVGGLGSGKSTLALTLAELFSDHFNVALLKSAASDEQIASQLMQQWFGLSAQSDVALSEQVAAHVDTIPLLLIIDDTEQFSAILPQLLGLPCLLISFSSAPLLDDGLTLTINRPTTADAEYLLQKDQLNSLEISTRLVDANGNLHLLLQPAAQATPGAIIPEHTKPTVPPFKTLYVGIAAVLVVMLLYYFWPETAKPETPVRIPVQIPSVTPEPEQVGAQPDNTAVEQAVAEPELLPVVTPATPEQFNIEENIADAEDVTPVAEQAASEQAASEQAVSETEQPPAAESFKYDEAQLLGMDKQQVALQLAVLSGDAALQRFKRAYPEQQSLIYQRSWQGKIQWVLLLAPFDNAAAAKRELVKLPQPLQATGPFVKKLQAVQAEITALHQQQQSVSE